MDETTREQKLTDALTRIQTACKIMQMDIVGAGIAELFQPYLDLFKRIEDDCTEALK